MYEKQNARDPTGVLYIAAMLHRWPCLYSLTSDSYMTGDQIPTQQRKRNGTSRGTPASPALRETLQGLPTPKLLGAEGSGRRQERIRINQKVPRIKGCLV